MQHCRLQAAEAEVIGVAQPGAGQALLALGPLRHSLYLRPSGESKAQDTGCLVKSLPRSIVPRPPQQPVDAMPLHQHQVGVSTRGHQAQKGEADARSRVVCLLVIPLQPSSVYMGLKVVHPHQGQPLRQCQCLGPVQPHQQRPSQTRPVRHRYGIKLRHGDACIIQGLLYRRHQRQHMLP